MKVSRFLVGVGVLVLGVGAALPFQRARPVGSRNDHGEKLSSGLQLRGSDAPEHTLRTIPLEVSVPGGPLSERDAKAAGEPDSAAESLFPEIPRLTRTGALPRIPDSFSEPVPEITGTTAAPRSAEAGKDAALPPVAAISGSAEVPSSLGNVGPSGTVHPKLIIGSPAAVDSTGAAEASESTGDRAAGSTPVGVGGASVGVQGTSGGAGLTSRGAGWSSSGSVPVLEDAGWESLAVEPGVRLGLPRLDGDFPATVPGLDAAGAFAADALEPETPRGTGMPAAERATGMPAAAAVRASAATAAPRAPWATSGDQSPTLRRHRIRDGDTLPDLARRYLGDAARYLEIFEANRDVLQRPDLLPLNAIIVVPTTADGHAPTHPAPPSADGWRASAHATGVQKDGG